MKFPLAFLTTLLSLTSASPLLSRQTSPTNVAYLNAFFFGAEPKVYFDLSNGNNPLSFSPLNSGAPILTATTGTAGARDPNLVLGGGPDAGNKWYILATDLDIGKTTWDAAQRKGSLGIFVWESTDLVNWGTERLVKVEADTAGMVWAPEAIWDAAKGEYLVHWASKFYPESDPEHSGPPSTTVIRYAYTKDFRTFSEPSTYVDYSPTNVIDLNILPLGGDRYARFLKNETSPSVFYETTDGGLSGTWTRPGGEGSIVRAGVEGPTSYFDNEDPTKAYVLLDYYASDGYRPFVNTDLSTNNWVDADRSAFPSNRRHGSVIGIDQRAYDALRKAYGS
ncbi:hypothetical protein KVT40_001623 [Elsinoe batatas]|uniref:Glycoside hydrolase family 43 protein n=1 Tax=Elsinoe batatas TaxID=2601811 RepID=A0A8K0L5C6_9PEZI|nr:hypothetical protein KVT40_001623 [Elsinoe batatas]